MTINELHIQFDLYPENRIDILEDVARKCNEGYLFVDLNDGHCYLFDKNGNKNDVKKIKSIEDGAFWNCKNLKSIEIPDSIESIGNSAFEWCGNLKSIVIPNSVKKIGNWAFEWCGNLKSIVIPNSVKKIGNWAFCNCKSLESIIIPDSVESIGDWAFAYCENLKSVLFKGKTMKQIKEMKCYPFGIEDESIIRCI